MFRLDPSKYCHDASRAIDSRFEMFGCGTCIPLKQSDDGCVCVAFNNRTLLADMHTCPKKNHEGSREGDRSGMSYAERNHAMDAAIMERKCRAAMARLGCVNGCERCEMLLFEDGEMLPVCGETPEFRPCIHVIMCPKEFEECEI